MRNVLGLAALALVLAAGAAVAGMMPVHLPPSAPDPTLEPVDLDFLSADKTTVCHKHTGSGNNERYVTINPKAATVENHVAHGDCYYLTDYPSGCDCNPLDADGNDICDSGPTC
jgi:hypothetical protein